MIKLKRFHCLTTYLSRPRSPARPDVTGRYIYGLLLDKRNKILWQENATRICAIAWHVSGKFSAILFAAYFVRYCSPKTTQKMDLTSRNGVLHAIDTLGYRWITRSLSYATIQRVMAPDFEATNLQKKLR